MKLDLSVINYKDIEGWCILLANTMDVDKYFDDQPSWTRHAAFRHNNNGEHILTFRFYPYGLEVYAKNHFTRQFIGGVKIPASKVDDYIRRGLALTTLEYVDKMHDKYLQQKREYVKVLRDLK